MPHQASKRSSGKCFCRHPWRETELVDSGTWRKTAKKCAVWTIFDKVADAGFDGNTICGPATPLSDSCGTHDMHGRCTCISSDGWTSAVLEFGQEAELQRFEMTRTQLEDVPDAVDRASQAMNCTAEIAVAAYSFLLRSGIRGSWIDLQLDVWKTLEEVAGKSMPRQAFAAKAPHDADGDSLPVVEFLTDEVYWTALRHGLRRPFVDIELGLHRALQGVMSSSTQAGG